MFTVAPALLVASAVMEEITSIVGAVVSTMRTVNIVEVA